MSMELLTHDFLDEFYSPEDANRAVREHLEGIVSDSRLDCDNRCFQHLNLQIPVTPKKSGISGGLNWVSDLGRFSISGI